VLRFSLRWLFIFVAFVAVGLVSLRYASFLISGCLSVVWLLFLMVSILGAIYRREQRRAFWVGCCVFGWCFAASGTVSGDKTTALDQAIQSVYEKIQWNTRADSATVQAHFQSGGRTVMGGPTNIVYFPREAPFKKAAETLVGFVVAFIGGVVAQWFYASRDRDRCRGEQNQ
jgi:hypothetical protein